MGFFGKLWNGIKEAALTVTAVALSPVILPTMIIEEKFNEKVDERVKEKLKETNKNIGKSGSLNENSSASQIEDLGNLLFQYSKEYRTAGEKTEDACKKYVRDCFNKLIEEFHKDENIADLFGLEQIQRKKNRLCSDIDGTITDAIRKNLSLDNPKCVEILKLPAGSDKERKMKNFAQKVIDDARDDLAQKVSRTMNQVTDDISNFLQDYVDDQERKAANVKNQFEQWERDMENQNFDREKAQLPALQKIYALEQIEKILAA